MLEAVFVLMVIIMRTSHGTHVQLIVTVAAVVTMVVDDTRWMTIITKNRQGLVARPVRHGRCGAHE
jgi:hypothetical protein